MGFLGPKVRRKQVKHVDFLRWGKRPGIFNKYLKFFLFFKKYLHFSVKKKNHRGLKVRKGENGAMFTKERSQSHLWTSCSCEWILILAPNSFPWHASAKFSRCGICPWVDQIIGGGTPTPTPCTLLNRLLSLCLSVSSSHPHHGVSGLAFYPSPYFPSLSHPSPFGLPLP